MFALKMLDVAAVISTTAVGSLNPDYKPGELVLLDQFIDMTKAREGTFYDGERYGVAHLDMSHPYCASLREAILAAGRKEGITLTPAGDLHLHGRAAFRDPGRDQGIPHVGR